MLTLTAPRRPRFAQLAFLVVAAFILTNKVYSPQYVLWLIPLAALARPRWRDFLIWQACEVMYFLGIWMYLAYTTSGDKHQGLPTEGYQLAIAVHLLGTLYLCAVVVRDILMPERDVVRSDGSDDPSGGVLDGAEDVFVLGHAATHRPRHAAHAVEGPWVEWGATHESRHRLSRASPEGCEPPARPWPQRSFSGSAQAPQRSTRRSNCVVVWRRWATSSSPTFGSGASARYEQDRHLHVRRLGEPALLARPDERRQVAVDRGQAGAGDALGPRHHAVQRLGGLQAHAVRRTAGDDHQPAVGGGLLLAVAEPVALGDTCDVEDGAAVLGRVVVAEPQPRADAGAEAGLRELLLQPGQFLGPQMADEHGVQRQPGRAQPVHPADDLLDRVRAVRAVQRQVQGEALEAYVLDGGVQLAQLLLA